MGGSGGGESLGGRGGGGGRSGGLGLASMPPTHGGGTPTSGTQGTGGGGGGGGGQGNLGLASVAANAIGTAAISTISRFGQSRIGDATASDILASQFSARGGGGKRAWMGGGGLSGFGGYSRADDRQAAAVLATQYNPSAAAGSSYQVAKSSQNQALLSGLFPGISATEYASARAQGAVPQTANRLRQIGIQTTGSNGAALTPSQVAKQILNRVSPQYKNADGIRRELMPGGSLDQWFEASGITGSTRMVYEDALFALVTGGKGASKIDSQTRKVANAKDKSALMTDQGVVSGAVAADQVQLFGQSVKQFALSVTHLGNAIGKGTGFGQGLGSKVLGFGVGLVSSVLGGIGSLFGIGGATPGSSGGMGSPGGGGGIGGGIGGIGGAAKSGGGATAKGSQAGSAKTAPSLKHVWPVGPGNISQGFNVPPNHHPGVDFPRAGGTPIHSAADGVVLFAGFAQGFGSNFVVVQHPAENKVTRYGHGSARLCKVGDSVKAGTVIALVGTEGQSTGNHLHLELASGSALYGNASSNMDPLPWLGGAGVSSSTDTGNTSDTSSSGQSGSATAGAASSGQSGFGTISIAEGITSSLLQGGGVPGASQPPSTSSGSSSSSSGDSASSGTLNGMVAGDWAKKLPVAGQRWASLIQGAAHATGVNPALIAAVMNTESGFINQQGSGDGLSAGLMQFIASTGAAYGLKTHADHLNPQKDILAGAQYLRDLLMQHGGDVHAALGAYNGSGPGGNYDNVTSATFKSYGDGGGIGKYAKGSWEIERDQAAIVHKGEMIVPSAAASVLRASASGPRGSSGPVTIHIHMANGSNSEMMRIAKTVQSVIANDSLHHTLAST